MDPEIVMREMQGVCPTKQRPLSGPLQHFRVTPRLFFSRLLDPASAGFFFAPRPAGKLPRRLPRARDGERNRKLRRTNDQLRLARGRDVSCVVGRQVVDGVRRGGGRVDDNIAHELSVEDVFEAEILIDFVDAS